MKITPIGFLIGSAIGFGIYKIAKASSGDKDEIEEEAKTTPSPGTTQNISGETGRPSSTVQLPSATSNDLIIEVDLKVSGLEKAFYSKKDASKKIKPIVIKAAKVLCEHAPKLVGEPTIKVVNSKNGYKVFVHWPAEWTRNQSGPVRKSVRDCLLQNFLATPQGKKVKSRIKSFKVYRV